MMANMVSVFIVTLLSSWKRKRKTDVFHELKIFACCFDRITVHMFKLVNPGFFVELVIFDYVEHGRLL